MKYIFLFLTITSLFLIIIFSSCDDEEQAYPPTISVRGPIINTDYDIPCGVLLNNYHGSVTFKLYPIYANSKSSSTYNAYTQNITYKVKFIGTDEEIYNYTGLFQDSITFDWTPTFTYGGGGDFQEKTIYISLILPFEQSYTSTARVLIPSDTTNPKLVCAFWHNVNGDMIGCNDTDIGVNVPVVIKAYVLNYSNTNDYLVNLALMEDDSSYDDLVEQLPWSKSNDRKIVISDWTTRFVDDGSFDVTDEYFFRLKLVSLDASTNYFTYNSCIMEVSN